MGWRYKGWVLEKLKFISSRDFGLIYAAKLVFFISGVKSTSQGLLAKSNPLSKQHSLETAFRHEDS